MHPFWLLVVRAAVVPMRMSEFYGETDDAESVRTIHRALDLGISVLDTADVNGGGDNEVLVGGVRPVLPVQS